MGNNTVQAKQWFDMCYSDSAPSETTVKRWHANFKRGRTDTNDVKRSGHPNSAAVPENTKKLHNLILADRKLRKLCILRPKTNLSTKKDIELLEKL